jgi:hypothetical protein
MNGSEILNEVRFIIDDLGYTRYTEINRAYRELARATKHNWLRGESEEKITFVDGESDYWIDLTGIRVFKTLRVEGNDTGRVFWHQMEEVSASLFEERRTRNLNPDGTNREARPRWYKIVESDNQRLKIQVTPVPDETYSARVEYIKDIETIDARTVPCMPDSYHDLIADMAAGIILMRTNAKRGQVMMSKATRDAVNGLVKDAHTNRTENITRPRRSVNEFI